MLRTATLLAAAAGAALSASAQTTLAGRVGNEMSVEGVVRVEDAHIPSGGVLRVQPGATLDFGPQSRLVVDGTLLIGGDPGRPVVLSGSAPEAVVRLGVGGQARFDGVRIEMESAGSLLAADSELGVEIRDLAVVGGRFESLLRGGAGRIALDRVRITGASFGGPVVDAPHADLDAVRFLLADAEVVSPVFRAASVTFAFATIAELRSDQMLSLTEAPTVRVETSVVWPGVPYVGSQPDIPVALSESIIEGGWSQFMGTLTRSRRDGRDAFDLSTERPTFLTDGTYRLAPGTEGADRLPVSRSADADGTRGDFGAYGGGRRRPALTLAVGVQTAAIEGELSTFRGPLPTQGSGMTVSALQELSPIFSVRARAGVFATDVVQPSPGTDRFSTVNGAVALISRLRLVGPVRVELGPQLGLQRSTYAYGAEAQAYHERQGRTLTDARDLNVRGDLVIGAHVALPRGAGVQAGVDIPILPLSWSDWVDVQSNTFSGTVVRRRVASPRLHLGVSVRMR